jgi:DNA-binding NarL/FixJ family response regulator
MEKIRIFLSDPQVLFREGMHFTLSAEEDLEVTGETTNNEEALAFIETDPPNIAILNMKNGKLDGPTVTRRIKRTFPSVSVMLITDRDEEDLLFTALKCGASAYLTKDVNPEYLLDLIRVIAQGGQPIIESLMIPELASRIQEEFKALTPLNKQFSNILANLSPREAEILGRITAGNDIKQIATGINSNEETIRKHLRSIVNKLVANDQARAVIDLAQQGLLPIAPDTGPVSGYAGYVTKNEFNEFKETLIQRLTSLIKGSP